MFSEKTNIWGTLFIKRNAQDRGLRGLYGLIQVGHE